MSARADEFHHKRQQIIKYLQAHELEAVILTRRCNFAWLTAGGSNHVSLAADVGAASLVVTPQETICVTTTIEAPRIADEELAGMDVPVRAAAWYDGGAAKRLWAELIGRRRAACDARVSGLPEHVKGLGGDFDVLRWTLLPPEIERYRQLAREVTECVEAACRAARPGMREFELAGRIAGPLLERGIRTPVVLIAADERVRRYRHPIPTEIAFRRHGMAVCGAERGGLIVSVSRLFSFGPLEADLRRRHEAVCGIDAVMIAATRPGKTLGGIFALAKQAYAEAGFPDEWQHHHQGGPTGYLAREAKATPGNATPVRLNQAFAWNPSIAGTKSEDTILVGPEKNEILSRTGQWPVKTYRTGGQPYDRSEILEI